jgi:hypothetical protein
LDNGELAIVPGATQEKDVVCILSGTCSPCALRSKPGGSWSLVSGPVVSFPDNDRISNHDGIGFDCDEYITQSQDKIEDF